MRPPRDIPPSLIALALMQGALLSSAQCDAAGVTRGQRTRLVASGIWQRPTRGVLDVAPGDGIRDPERRRRRAAWLGLLAYGPEAVAVGQCALVLHGVAGVPAHVAPEVALPRGRSIRPRDGIRVRYFEGTQVMRYGPRQIAALVPALVQALPDLPRRHAVAVLDDVLHRGLLTDQGLAVIEGLLVGRRGAVEVRNRIRLVDRRAESPLETFARLDCVDGGVPPDELQVEIRDRHGAFVARGDLGWRLPGGRWLIVEVDGREVHEAPVALLRDRRRQNAMLATAHVELLRVTADDIGRRGTVAALVRTALAHVR
ncbi:type IV toxin-antitoxin system AbiEi family antitoxin domain-containing protein [Cellulomonas sp. URHD0024]|uniref:type IV toxin-antitoxin system AbiEi family antitoxin domain-containing protein n=1 Tax=Cellulomonas sp. URHD0024 TaxID=1302620 RepID=UPI001E2B8B52|nr:type IV toxin-antitoxin system AbiEi family antitoxin domain-containing protein [Cellulomonas sp. URHD0024]